MKRIDEAIINLLQLEVEYIDAEEIFMRLNLEGKSYSYAAVYDNIRKLIKRGLLEVQLKDHDRKKYYSVFRDTDADL